MFKIQRGQNTVKKLIVYISLISDIKIIFNGIVSTSDA